MAGLSDVDVPIAESQINLNWGPIMKTINEDPSDFFAGGGWGFLPVPGATGSEVCLPLWRTSSRSLIIPTEWLFGLGGGVHIRRELRERCILRSGQRKCL